VRELTRVATPDTEAEWLEASEGKTANDVQRLAAGRVFGQTPKDPADPRRIRHGMRFDMPAEWFALFREAVRSLQRTVDPRITDEEALAVMSRMVLGGPGDEGRSPYQVALVQCEDCGRVWQDARGDSIEVPPEVAERAACDGQFIGRVDGQSPGGPTARSPAGPTTQSPAGPTAQSPRGRKKASQTIPPAIRRQVLRRDRGRCSVPSCRNSSWIEVHHLRLRSELGDHSLSNILSLCDCHHDRVHQGFLLVEGDAEGELTFRHPDGSVYGTDANPQIVSVHGAAYGALRQLGFKETESKQALARVRSLGGPNRTLEEVIRLALSELSTGLA
jgi:RuvA, C-terminal domain